MVGVELKTPVTPIAAALMQRGVLCAVCGNNVLRFLPPLVIEEPELDQVVSALAEVLKEVPEAIPMGSCQATDS
jgi:acetylornithine/succinyldiaminopimelate/putrescine aminotransferase